jgi:hypothetical protein
MKPIARRNTRWGRENLAGRNGMMTFYCSKNAAADATFQNGFVALIHFSQAIKKEYLTAESTEVTEARNAHFAFFSRCSRCARW